MLPGRAGSLRSSCRLRSSRRSWRAPPTAGRLAKILYECFCYRFCFQCCFPRDDANALRVAHVLVTATYLYVSSSAVASRIPPLSLSLSATVLSRGRSARSYGVQTVLAPWDCAPTADGQPRVMESMTRETCFTDSWWASYGIWSLVLAVPYVVYPPYKILRLGRAASAISPKAASATAADADVGRCCVRISETLPPPSAAPPPAGGVAAAEVDERSAAEAERIHHGVDARGAKARRRQPLANLPAAVAPAGVGDIMKSMTLEVTIPEGCTTHESFLASPPNGKSTTVIVPAKASPGRSWAFRTPPRHGARGGRG